MSQHRIINSRVNLEDKDHKNKKKSPFSIYRLMYDMLSNLIIHQSY